MVFLPILPLDIELSPGVLSRRGAVTFDLLPNDFYQKIFNTSNTEVTAVVDSFKQNAIFVRISEDATLSSTSTTESSHENNRIKNRRYSDTDRQLIDNLDTNNDRIRLGSRFLTMHKRRRKRLTTRSLSQEPGLLDDIFHGQVQCVLQRAGHWRFNAFTLETVSGGRSLPVLCVHLFQWYGLLKQFKLDVVRVWKLFALIEEGYHSTNPYHNSIHATDVTQAMHCFLQEEKIRKHLTSLEIMASLIAAVTHDLDHPGVNQPFLVATSNHLAKLYENTSVLENHHWRSAIACLLESGVSEQLSPDIRPELQRYISSLILATDITRQQEFLSKFKSYQDKNILDMEKSEYRHFILQISLKCADISNPCRSWDISKKWSYKVCEEFFRQGDYERQLNLPVTPLCDREIISIPKIQSGFFQFVVTPLYNEWHRFLGGDGLSIILMNNLKTNQKKWESLIAQQETIIIDEIKTDISDFEEQVQNSPNSDDDICDNNNKIQEEELYSIDVQLPKILSTTTTTTTKTTRRLSLPYNYDKKLTGRRHSVPISIKQLSLPNKKSSSSSSSSSSTTTTTTSSSSSSDRCRRESVPNEYHYERKTPLVKLDNQSLNKLNSLSSLLLLSSQSSLIESITNTSTTERPVSAENLLPETSIASITSSIEASRLSNVLQPQLKQLTRQQTFPPLQPYVRVRYLSTTAEMTQCKTDILIEAADSQSSSNSSPSSRNSISKTTSDKIHEHKINKKSYKIDNQRHQHQHQHHHHHHHSGKRRESAYADFNKLNVDSAFISGDERRRHSVQGVKSDELPLSRHYKNHHHHHHHHPHYQHQHQHQQHHHQKRPSSAQETDPTQVFYATLTGVTTFKHKSIGSDSAPLSQSDSDRQWSLEESVVEEQHSPDQFMPLPEENPSKFKDSEGFRRFSTSINDNKNNCLAGFRENNSGRRFTMIPVASELPSQKVFFIGSPPESPPRHKSSVSSSSDSGSEPRRSIGETYSEPISYYKGSKIQKLCTSGGCDDGRMKENVDPRFIVTDEIGKSQITGRRIAQGWARRRGSAPVGLMFRLDDGPLTMRRGSVPADIANQTFICGGSFRSVPLGIHRGENQTSPRRASLPLFSGNIIGNIFPLSTDERENFCLNNNNNNNNNSNTNTNQGMPSPRRGSVPADISELRRDLFGRNSINGKNQQRNRKKTLRRRRSGGPEMFSLIDDNDNAKWSGWKREFSKRDSIPEPSVKRRGSLPVEMLSISHAGIGGDGGGGNSSGIAGRKSSLWRL